MMFAKRKILAKQKAAREKYMLDIQMQEYLASCNQKITESNDKEQDYLERAKTAYKEGNIAQARQFITFIKFLRQRIQHLNSVIIKTEVAQTMKDDIELVANFTQSIKSFTENLGNIDNRSMEKYFKELDGVSQKLNDGFKQIDEIYTKTNFMNHSDMVSEEEIESILGLNTLVVSKEQIQEIEAFFNSMESGS